MATAQVNNIPSATNPSQLSRCSTRLGDAAGDRRSVRSSVNGKSNSVAEVCCGYLYNCLSPLAVSILYVILQFHSCGDRIGISASFHFPPTDNPSCIALNVSERDDIFGVSALRRSFFSCHVFVWIIYFCWSIYVIVYTPIQAFVK